MRVFIIEFDDLDDALEGGVGNLMEFIVDNRFEYWKYFSHQIAIATPDQFDSKYILDTALKLLGNDIQVSVFEINLNSYAGYGPTNFMSFFDLLKHPKYIPVWERKGFEPYGISNILEMEGIPKSLKRKIANL